MIPRRFPRLSAALATAVLTATATLAGAAAVAAFFAATAATGPAAATSTGDVIVGRAEVDDGDTIRIGGERIRLYGIDAPEHRQSCTRKGRSWPCGRRAARALSTEIGRDELRCRVRDRDLYGRAVAVCFRGARDLNGWLVRNGWAVAYRRYSRNYVHQEETAKRRRAGIWAGDFIMPWDWRRGRR